MTVPPPADPTRVLHQLVCADGGDFAVLYRPHHPGRLLEVFFGQTAELDSLADLDEGVPESDVSRVVLVPYRQITERGYACHDDYEPLLCLTARTNAAISIDWFLSHGPSTLPSLADSRFVPDDDAYARLVRTVQEDIGSGEGSNFVVHRTYRARVSDWGRVTALAMLRALLMREQGAYWTFLLHAHGRTWIGASPERHLTLADDTVTMSPISGTYPYPSGGPTLSSLLSFLADHKEQAELYMVLDEELKILARMCPEGGRVRGPWLREMSRLAHTEYVIEGHCSSSISGALRQSLLAPTVTGSPVENACRVIADRERVGRGYYSGVVALLSPNAEGRQNLDSAIVLRTADISTTGDLSLSVGATVVRDSHPADEATETRVKAAGWLSALHAHTPNSAAKFTDLTFHPRVQVALHERNHRLSWYWQADYSSREIPHETFLGRRALLIDYEDTFTAMLARQLNSIGLHTTVDGYCNSPSTSDYDLVVLGPGPGDPQAAAHPKIRCLRQLVQQFLTSGRPFAAVCLAHQVLCSELRFPLIRKPVPNQGVQGDIDFFGTPASVAFYNSFAACYPLRSVPGLTSSIDPRTREIHALRGPHFASVQFHPESVLTKDGPRLLTDLLAPLISHR